MSVCRTARLGRRSGGHIAVEKLPLRFWGNIPSELAATCDLGEQTRPGDPRHRLLRWRYSFGNDGDIAIQIGHAASGMLSAR